MRYQSFPPPLLRVLRVFAVGFLILVSSVDFAFPADKNLPPPFEIQVSKILNQPKFEADFWGAQIVSLKDNRILFSLNAKKRFLPASNLKLLLAAAVLDRLGSDYRFETPVYAEGRIDSYGRVLGNAVLVGSGDPNLAGRIYNAEEERLPKTSTPPFIELLAHQIAGRGIKHIEGDIVADDSAFLYEPYGKNWNYEDLLWGYGAPVSALAVNENVFSVEVWPGDAVGDPALIRVTPFFDGLSLVNQVKTVGSGRQPFIQIEHNLERCKGSLIAPVLTFYGELAQSNEKLDYTLAVADPAEFAALLLKAALEHRGVFIAGKAIARHLRPSEVLENGKPSLDRAKNFQPHYAVEQRIAKYQSVPLIETLKIMMKVSHNLYAEMLLRKLGAESSGIGSVEAGVTALKSFLERTGTSKEQLNLSDGSGLSRTNLITPESIIRLLQYMEKHPQGQWFFDTLPVGGTDGTLKDRMLKTVAAGRIYAKTGTLRFVNSLSGYALSASGEKLAFSILVNNHSASTPEVREAIDQICALMAQYESRKKAPKVLSAKTRRARRTY